MWLGEWSFGQRDGMSSALAPILMARSAIAFVAFEIDQRHIAVASSLRSTEQKCVIMRLCASATP